MASIRRAIPGDENILAYIQTESWKSAFSSIVESEILEKCTDINTALQMYKELLAKDIGNGYIQEVDGQPHCIAWWDASRDKAMPGYAELICIHSLPERWHQGYGTKMLNRIINDITAAGYKRVMLWVFEDNTRAKDFYRKNGFIDTDRKQTAFGAVEVLFIREL